MFELKILPSANKDLQDISDYISQDNPIKAISFVRELRQKIENLCHNPYIYQKMGVYHKMTQGNYIIVYRVNAAKKLVTIVKVTEGHRNWQI